MQLCACGFSFVYSLPASQALPGTQLPRGSASRVAVAAATTPAGVDYCWFSTGGNAALNHRLIALTPIGVTCRIAISEPGMHVCFSFCARNGASSHYLMETQGIRK